MLFVKGDMMVVNSTKRKTPEWKIIFKNQLKIEQNYFDFHLVFIRNEKTTNFAIYEKKNLVERTMQNFLVYWISCHKINQDATKSFCFIQNIFNNIKNSWIESRLTHKLHKFPQWYSCAVEKIDLYIVIWKWFYKVPKIKRFQLKVLHFSDKFDAHFGAINYACNNSCQQKCYLLYMVQDNMYCEKWVKSQAIINVIIYQCYTLWRRHFHSNFSTVFVLHGFKNQNNIFKNEIKINNETNKKL